MWTKETENDRRIEDRVMESSINCTFVRYDEGDHAKQQRCVCSKQGNDTLGNLKRTDRLEDLLDGSYR
jgi:hypothetical protein